MSRKGTENYEAREARVFRLSYRTYLLFIVDMAGVMQIGGLSFAVSPAEKTKCQKEPHNVTRHCLGFVSFNAHLRKLSAHTVLKWSGVLFPGAPSSFLLVGEDLRMIEF